MNLYELDQPKEWVNKFIAFSGNPRGFILMAGKNGTGKTTVATSIYDNMKFVNRNPQIDDKLFFTQVDLFMKWTKDLKQWGETTYLYERLITTQLLVLDDIGTRSPSEAFKDFIYAVIEKRERHKDELGTILTTNLNAIQMREMFGDAIVSRVASSQVFRFEGNERRFHEF